MTNFQNKSVKVRNSKHEEAKLLYQDANDAGCIKNHMDENGAI